MNDYDEFPARGIFIGCVGGLLMWAVLIVIVVAVTR